MITASLQPRSKRTRARPVPLGEALRMLTAGLGAVEESRVALDEAGGLTLARPLTAARPVPERHIALRGGWAVRSDETMGAGPYSPTLLATRPSPVARGEALPPGTDCVMPEDAVWAGPTGFEASVSAAPGHWVRRAGEDLAAAAVLREAGQSLSLLDIGVARSAGLSFCHVRRPKLSILSSPDQLSRSPALSLLARLAASRGAEVSFVPGADLCRHEAALIVGLLGSEPPGLPLLAQGIALQPGEDTCIRDVGRSRPVLLSDRMADALAVWLALLSPCLDLLRGAIAPERVSGRLTRKLSSRVGFAEIALLVAGPGGLEPIAVGDLPLSAMSRADLWCLIPSDSEGFPAGATLSAERLGEP